MIFWLLSYFGRKFCVKILSFVVWTKFYFTSQKSVNGKCIILAPPKQMEVFIEGLAFLQEIDSNMFHRLTDDNHFFFVYVKNRTGSFDRFFCINDAFLSWGQEGVAIYFAQAVLDFSLMCLPAKMTRIETRTTRIITRCEIQKQLLNWIYQHSHSFDAALVKHYEEIARLACERVPNNKGG